jgi:hypothetical protein
MKAIGRIVQVQPRGRLVLYDGHSVAPGMQILAAPSETGAGARAVAARVRIVDSVVVWIEPEIPTLANSDYLFTAPEGT